MTIFRVLILCALASNIYFIRFRCHNAITFDNKQQQYKSVLISKISKRQYDDEGMQLKVFCFNFKYAYFNV